MSGRPRSTAPGARTRRALAVAVRTAVLVLAPAGPVPSAEATQDQHRLFEFTGVEAGDLLGRAVAGVGDLDGDGVGDYALGAPRSLGRGAGWVRVVDGATGAVRLEFSGSSPLRGASARFGAALALLPDLDGDGVAELAVGVPGDDGAGRGAGAVELRSLADGALLLRLEGLAGDRFGAALATFDADGDGFDDLVVGAPGGGAVEVRSSAWLSAAIAGGEPSGAGLVWAVEGAGALGATLAPLGDLDGDGVAELAVGAPAADGPPAGVDGAPTIGVGAVEVRSGADGGLLRRSEGVAAGEALGSALAALASVDGDGLDELAVGAPGAGGERAGEVRVLRGAFLATGAGPERWTTLVGGTPRGLFGRDLIALGDVDGDGAPELAVAEPRTGAGLGPGVVRVLRALDGGAVLTLDAVGSGDAAGAGLAALDLTGDGVRELLVGAPLDTLANRGGVRALSIEPLLLAADRHRIDVGAGGTLTLSLDAGPAAADRLYLVAGSATGTAPGIPTAAGVVPLAVDAFTLLTLSGPPELSGFWGLLDAQGRGAATAAYPPELAELYAPHQLWFAAVVVDLSAGGAVVAVSRAAPLGFDLDQCEPVGPEQDCDGDGVADLCAVLDGTAVDCDGNGVPDVCQLAQPGADLDHDGVLDVCRVVVRVDPDAVGAGDGSSWADAFTDLRVALAAAPPFAELWVAEGVHRPGPPDGPQDQSFLVDEGRALFGGFAGHETARDQRDPVAHPTVLSGDLAGDDPPGAPPAGNAWSVLRTALEGGPPVRIDGFVIERGSADDVQGCTTFMPNAPSCRGGGAYLLGAPVIANCVFRDNYGGGYGGAVFVQGAATFVRCVFEDNGALRGGAVFVHPGSRPVLVACTLRRNTALFGGALAAEDGPEPIALHGCLVVGNRALDAGGALHLEAARVELVQSAVLGNTAAASGGGLVGDGLASAEVVNSILWANTAPSGSPLDQALDLPATVAWSCVQGGGALPGPGVFASDPGLTALPGPDGLFGTADDDPRPAPGSPCLDAGDSLALSQDVADLDGDGDRTEPLPLDLDGGPRVVDDPAAPDLGLPGPAGAVVDLGPHER